MSQLVPNRFLFKFEIPLHRAARALKIDGRADDWDDRFLLPALHQLDAEQGFGRVYAAWNEGGLYIACHVEGKTQPPRCDASRFWKSDNLRLMTDMRDTRTIRFTASSNDPKSPTPAPAQIAAPMAPSSSQAVTSIGRPSASANSWTQTADFAAPPAMRAARAAGRWRRSRSRCRLWEKTTPS